MSFTQAAAELNVTQSAASRMVRALEDYLQLALFARNGRRIALTAEGQFYAETIRDAMNRLEEGTTELVATRSGQGTLSIGMQSSFGTRWLLPRLSSFQEAYPELAVSVVSSDGPLDFGAERIDVALRFGFGNWPDAIAEPLMSEELCVVCSPRIMDGPYPLTDYSDLARHRLLVHSSRPGSWEHWLRSTGTDGANLQWGLRLEHFYMLLQAAVAGLGVALLPTFLVEEEIAVATFFSPFGVRIGGPGAYYLVTPTAKAGLPRVRAFRDWVLGQVAA